VLNFAQGTAGTLAFAQPKSKKPNEIAVMMVLKLPTQYGTPIAFKACSLSGKQRRRAQLSFDAADRSPYMDWLRRVTNVPATETQTGLVLAVCIFTMSLMSIALVWQAQVIAKQNAVIRMLETRFGS
jgi:hypothetical protein